ncbi:glycosyltransferase family 92 protein RCOM_0530710-like isoform X1 [Benincasa hispida]|uniref:glycosyltransferase family 92 protein RCOM_0530710-like isoform X1 n=1 Tax=Benincasa hispida TaxID=102211 RepID=UPI001901BA9A|nr:glycosyltransferase family 92 protein RCOM_0530710-like isoform X1 [Benincasa hispida]
MRDRRKRDVVSWSALFWCTFFVVLSCVLFTSFRIFSADTFHPEVVHTRRTPLNKAVFDDFSVHFRSSVQETVTFPDQALVFLNHPPTVRPFAKKDIDCVYFAGNSSEPLRWRPAIDVDGEDRLHKQMVRCPLPPRGFTVSIRVRSNAQLQGGHSHRWDYLVYEALIDRDNTTVVFVKGLGLRAERTSNASKFECVYGWDFRKVKFLLRSEVMSIAQEIARCRTPLSLLSNLNRTHDSIKVSIRVKGGGTLNSIARPLLPSGSTTPHRKPHEMCICTMLRNQAQFLKEWIIYHAHLGVRRWFIYDNNSDDDIEDVIASIFSVKHNISRHIWPWIKTQEAGFAHCALRARDSCKWVGFIDVDEFFYLPNGLPLLDVLRNQAKNASVGEIRVSCHSFGPSGLTRMPPQGVMVGYTCRKASAERHKSIVNPEVLNSTLINVVHHFHLRDGFHYMNLERSEMVINHYKYQVWEVFKEKFHRRVATYVADWQEEQNVGSKDRAPGLGTKAVKPEDWSSRFCEINDTGLRDLVLQNLTNQRTHLLPWQEEHRRGRRRSRKKGKHKGFL